MICLLNELERSSVRTANRFVAGTSALELSGAGIEVDQVDRLVIDVTAEDVEVVAVIKCVRRFAHSLGSLAEVLGGAKFRAARELRRSADVRQLRG